MKTKANLKQLRELLIGTKIKAINPPDKDESEALCKFTVVDKNKTYSFHLHATNLGWWIGKHKANGLYTDFEDLIDDVGEFAWNWSQKACDDAGWPGPDDPFWKKDIEPSITRFDSLKNLTIGFKNEETGQTWEAPLQALKDYMAATGISLQTTEQRDRAAKILSEGVSFFVQEMFD